MKFLENLSEKLDFFVEKSEINYEENSFQSKTFMIKYYDEEIEMNDIILFQMSIDAYPNFDDHDLILEIELFGADVSKIGRNLDEEEPFFKKYTSFKSKINYYKEKGIIGFHEYFPILFDENQFCVCHANLHCILRDFRFESKLKTQGDQEKKSNLAAYLQPKTFSEFLHKATHKCNPFYFLFFLLT
jgi:hypothetical protein